MRAMKDSGAAWIGEIPAEWSKGKIGFFADFYNGDRTSRYPQPTDFVNSGIPFINSTNINGDYLDTSDCKYITREKYSSLSGAKIEVGDIIFCLRGSVGKCALNMHLTEGTVASSLMTIRPLEIEGKYLLYCLLSDVAGRQTDTYMNGTCAANLSAENVSRYVIPVPPSEEQRRIATFLDAECARIDAVIEKTRASIEEYKKLKQSVITEAVTKGIRSGRKMKDSGIEWIGEIPEEWVSINPKSLFLQRKEKALRGERQLTASQQYGVIYQDDYMELTGSKVVTVEKDFDILKHVEAGDFVISMRSFQGGLEYSTNTGSISSAYVMLIPNLNLVFPPFYKWLLKSPVYIDALQSTSNMVRDGQAMRFSNFAQVKLLFVPVDEQKEIAGFLEDRCLAIDELVKKKEQFVSEMESYKKSLIFEYVTGKKEVV